MITITQFTLPQLRAAHDILTKASKAQPAPAKAEPKAPAEAPPAEGEDAKAPATEDVSSAPEASTDSPPAETKDAAAPKAPAGPSAETLAELTEKLPLAENKVQYIVGALQVAGARVQKLRQVRVVQLEGAPANAVKRDEAAYLLDMLPEANRGQKRTDSRDGDRRGGKGRGRDGKPGDKRGFGGPGAPGGKGPGAGGDRPQAGRGPGRPGGTQTKRG